MEANCPVDNIIKESTTPKPLILNDQLDFPNFSLTQETLAKFLVDESINVHDIVFALEIKIHGDILDIYHRRTAFGSNLNFEGDGHKSCNSILTKDFFMISLEAFKDTSVILLLCCAILSCVIDIKRNGAEVAFRDGAMLFLTIFILVNFGTLCKIFKARRMSKKLSFRAAKSSVTVVRGGRNLKIPVSEIVVGDILILKPGDQVPADGLLVHAAFFDNITTNSKKKKKKYFSVFSGEKVAEGDCKMLVMSVGKNTERSKLMKSTRNTCDGEESNLQAAIDKTNSRLERIWLSLSLLILVVQVIRCFTLKSNSCCDENHNPDPKGVKNTVEEIMNEATKLIVKRQGGVLRANGLVALVCMVIFALRDGLPLGIFILLVFTSKKTKPYRQAFVRKLPACATVGLVTTICTTIDFDHTKMADLWVGQGNTIKQVSPEIVNHEVLDTLREGVCTNACGPDEDGLLWWAKRGLGCNAKKMNRSRTFLYPKSYDFDMNRSGVSLRRKKEDVENLVHVHWKGAPETILCMCSNYYDATDGSKQVLDEQKRAAFNEIVTSINESSDSLQCFAFAHKQVFLEQEEFLETIKPVEEGLTLLGMVAFKNPYPPEVREAVKTCTQEFRVNIKLLVGGDINTAKLIATQLGILKPNFEEDTDGAVIEASEFRNSSEKERMKMINRIRVMANSSPSDKLLMVQCLRKNGQVVAATGTTIRDSPVLKEADVGLFMGENGSETAKENADMVILDGNFTTVCEILNMGRCVCNTIGKFLELQLTLNMAAFILTLVIVVSTSEVPLSSFQLLWVNLIMDALGASALAAICSGGGDDQAAKSAAVYGAAGLIITKSMWRNITVQSGYQVIVLLIMYLKGNAIFDLEEREKNVLEVMVFNCYALCQVFMLIITGVKKREKAENFRWFIIIVGIILMVQVVVVEIWAVVTHTGQLRMKLWCICFGIASVSLLIDIAGNWFSNTF